MEATNSLRVKIDKMVDEVDGLGVKASLVGETGYHAMNACFQQHSFKLV